MALTNIKCIYCGKNFEDDNLNVESHCPYCFKKFETIKGIKYYKSIEKIQNEKIIELNANNFHHFEELIEKSNFYIQNEDYENSLNVLNEAIKISNSNLTLYLNFVKTLTKNFTDFKDELHIPYLQKAINLANKEEKENIKELYSNYYTKRNMTSDERNEVTAYEYDSKKVKVEQLLKDGIYLHYRKEKSIKPLTIVLIISLIIFLSTCVVSLLNIFESISNLLAIISSSFGIISFIIFFFLFGNKNKVDSYNVSLDLYDNLDTFDLSINDKLDVINELEILAVDYLNKSDNIIIEKHLSNILGIIYKQEYLKAIEFVNKYKLLIKLLKNYS